jgi:hypothetical protein
MALLAVLGARGTPREADARRLLDEALVNSPRRGWPMPVLRYFRGDIDEAGLLRAADGARQLADAHAFIGLGRLRSGDREGARAHLEFARDHGGRGSISADVARAAIDQITPVADREGSNHEKHERTRKGPDGRTPGESDASGTSPTRGPTGSGGELEASWSVERQAD